MNESAPVDRGDAVITLERVSKTFGSFVAVREAHLSIARGEFFALLGPSGCGKTTTLKIVAGFEQPTEGRVLLEGTDVSQIPPWQRNVNTVFQHYALFPHLTVADNVAFGPRSRGVAPDEVASHVEQMLGVVGLVDLAGRQPSSLSGGQQQRVALARALVNLPSALLLDEPLAALDQKLREAMQLELKRIQRDVGIAFLMVTHDQGEALTMSDRLAVMSEGLVEQIGTPEEIYQRPASLFVAGFIGSANLLPGTVTGADGDRTVTALSSGASVASKSGADGMPPGTRCSVMIRPERLHPSVEPPAEGRGLQARVVDLIFQGATARLRVALADGTELVMHLPSHVERSFLGAGESIWATWDRDAPYLVKGWPEQAGATNVDVDSVEASL